MDPFIVLLLGIALYAFYIVSTEHSIKKALKENPKLLMWKFFENNPLVLMNMVFFNAIFWTNAVLPLTNNIPGVFGFICVVMSAVFASPAGVIPVFSRVRNLFNIHGDSHENNSFEA